jgi:hypothetical protein
MSKMKKRDFLKAAGGLTVAAVLPAPFQGPALAHTLGRKPTAAIYDGRYAEARDFAGAMKRLGSPAFDARKDPAVLWYDLAGRSIVNLEKSIIAGLTTGSDLLVFQELAKERGLALTYRGIHDGRSRQHLQHIIGLPEGRSRATTALSRAGRRWPVMLADILNSGDLAVRSRVTESMRFQTPKSTDHPGCLVSWLLAPGWAKGSV